MAFVLYYFLCSFFFPCRRLISSCVVRFSASVGAELCSLFLVLPLLPDRCASCLRCLVPTLAAQFVVSAALSSWVSFCCDCLSCTCSGGAVCWSQPFVPSCCSCLLSSLGVSAAAFCHFGLLSHPILRLFLAWVSSFGVYSGLGLRCCGPGYGSSLFLGGGGALFPCPCCFSLAFTTLLFSR